MGGIIHVVQLKFKPDVGTEKIDSVMTQLRELKDKCVLPDTKKPYIQSVTAGKDNSIEGLQNGFTHMIVSAFESAEHRDYYAKKDPAHLAIVQVLLECVDGLKGLQVLDIDA